MAFRGSIAMWFVMWLKCGFWVQGPRWGGGAFRGYNGEHEGVTMGSVKGLQWRHLGVGFEGLGRKETRGVTFSSYNGVCNECKGVILRAVILGLYLILQDQVRGCNEEGARACSFPFQIDSKSIETKYL